MGNQDNWTTPKQLKIERKGEPKGYKRGVAKKGERKKGKKARIDEVLSGVGLCAQNAKKTHCKYGHALTSDNLYRLPSQPHKRICIKCREELQK